MRKAGLAFALFIALLSGAIRARADALPDVPGREADDTPPCRLKAEGELCNFLNHDGVCKTRKKEERDYPKLRCDIFETVMELDRAEARSLPDLPLLPSSRRTTLLLSLGVAALGAALLAWKRFRKRSPAAATAWRSSVILMALGGAGAIASDVSRPGRSFDETAYQGLVVRDGISRGPFSPDDLRHAFELCPGARGSSINWGGDSVVFEAAGRQALMSTFNVKGSDDEGFVDGFIGSFDPRTFDLGLWIGPFRGSAWFKWVVTREHLTVFDERGRARIVLLASGREVARMRLTVKVKRVATDAERETIWFSDESNLHQGILDPRSLEVTPVSRAPEWTQEDIPAGRAHCPARPTETKCFLGRSAKGYREVLDYRLERGANAVTFEWNGEKPPARLIARAADPGSQATRWTTTVSEMSIGTADRGGAFLDNDSVWVFYETVDPASRFNLARIDVASGKLLWAMPLDFERFSRRNLLRIEGAIFLSASAELASIDVETGHVLRALGPPITPYPYAPTPVDPLPPQRRRSGATDEEVLDLLKGAPGEPSPIVAP